MQQMDHFFVCQKCGRGIFAELALDDGWLVSPYRENEWVLVIRCYACISEWAMRQTLDGRTNELKALAKAGRERAATEIRMRPFAEPFPLKD